MGNTFEIFRQFHFMFLNWNAYYINSIQNVVMVQVHKMLG